MKKLYAILAAMLLALLPGARGGAVSVKVNDVTHKLLIPETNNQLDFSDITVSGLLLTPSITGQGGKVLSNNGSSLLWISNGGIWGNLTGNVFDQSDLGTILNAKQPLDSDLTAIASVATTAYGRGALALQNAPAFQSYIDAQPHDADLDAVAALTTNSFGLALLTKTNSAAVMSYLGFGSVENTAISTWPGSANIVTVGTITSGVWHGTAIGDSYISSAAAWSAKQAAYTNLTTFGGLANASGWLHNNGSGTFVYSTPTAADLSLGNLTNDVQTKAAIVPNTLPTSGQILAGNAGGTAYTPVTMSGDATFASTGAIAVAKSGGVAFGSAAFTASSAYEVPLTISTGLTRSVNTLTIDSTVATLTGSQALTNKSYNGNTITTGTGTLTLGSATLNVGTGGTLASAAFTASSAYATSAQGTKADNVGAVNGLVKSNGSASFSAAVANTDYLTGSSPTITTGTYNGTQNLTGRIKFTGVITPAQIAGDQNDYNPTGFSTAETLRLSSDATRNITGLLAGADGDFITLFNVGSFNIILKSENASSASANRFALASDITLLPNHSIRLTYDLANPSLPRWRALRVGPSVSEAFVTIGNSTNLTGERALTGTSNQITVTDGGADGNVTLSLPSTVVFPGTINGLTLTSSTGTLSIANGKTITLNNSMTFSSGTDAQTYTMPTTSTIAGYTSQTVGDADASITAGVRAVIMNATLTAQRTYTLPAANAVPAGFAVTVLNNGFIGSFSAKVQRAGSDTVNTTTNYTINNSDYSPTFVSDGVSKWQMPVIPLTAGGTSSTTASGARGVIGVGTLGQQSAGAVAITGGTMSGVAITTGSIADASLSSQVTKQANTFNGVSQLVQTNGSGLIPISLLSAGTGTFDLSNYAVTLPSAMTFQVRQGTFAELGTITLASGELGWTTDNAPVGKILYGGDGTTVGGIQVSPRRGQATLSGGTNTVTATWVTANTIIMLTPKGTTNQGYLSVSQSAGASFTITSANGSDARVINWMAMEP